MRFGHAIVMFEVKVLSRTRYHEVRAAACLLKGGDIVFEGIRVRRLSCSDLRWWSSFPEVVVRVGCPSYSCWSDSWDQQESWIVRR